jgi:hypothetical protein
MAVALALPPPTADNDDYDADVDDYSYQYMVYHTDYCTSNSNDDQHRRHNNNIIPSSSLLYDARDEYSFNYMVYNTDDYKGEDMFNNKRRNSTAALPYATQFIGKHLQRFDSIKNGGEEEEEGMINNNKPPSLETMAARVIIRYVKHPTTREKVLSEIPEIIRTVIHQAHVDMIDHWYRSALSPYPTVPSLRADEYTYYIQYDTFFQLSKTYLRHVYRGREVNRLCHRLNHRCAAMKNVRKRGINTRKRLVYCPINGRCICNCNGNSNADIIKFLLPETCTSKDMKYVFGAHELLPKKIRRKEEEEGLEKKIDRMGFIKCCTFKMKE